MTVWFYKVLPLSAGFQNNILNKIARFQIVGSHYNFTTIKSGPMVGLGRTGSNPNALGSIQYSTLVTMHVLHISAIERGSSEQTRRKEKVYQKSHYFKGLPHLVILLFDQAQYMSDKGYVELEKAPEEGTQ